MEVSKEEAIATALLAKFVGQQLNQVSALTTQSSLNNNTSNIDLNKVLSELSVIPDPKPEGPVITGVTIDNKPQEVVLHPISVPLPEPGNIVDIPNPFAKPIIPVSNISATPINNTNNLSPMAQFLKKPDSPPSIIHKETTTIAPILKDTDPETTLMNDSSILSLVLEKLIKIELQLTKIQKQFKKISNNENKSIAQ